MKRTTEQSSESSKYSSTLSPDPEQLTDLFVIDDDPGVIGSLHRTLHAHRDEFRPAFALGGQAALDLLHQLAEAPLTVVVTDMIMPNVDGTSILSELHRRRPEVARILLSGFAEQAEVLRVAPLAHRFLTKPCVAEDLVHALRDAKLVAATLGQTGLRTFVNGPSALPSTPRAIEALWTSLGRNGSPEAVGFVCENDIALNMKVLQLAGTDFFGSLRPLHGGGDAAAQLGADRLRELALNVGSLGAFRTATDTCGLRGRLVARINARAAEVAAQVLDLMAAPELKSQAQAASQAHHAGMLLLAERYPRKVANLLEEEGARAPCASPAFCGISAGVVGQQLVRLWGLPRVLIESSNHPQATDVDAHQDRPFSQCVAHVSQVLVQHLLPNENSPSSTAALLAEKLR